MTFEIRFLGGAEYCQEAGFARGYLNLKSNREYFRSSLSHWSENDYQQQWIDGLKRMINDFDSSALITDFPDPETAFTISLWPMWRVDDKTIAFQEHLIFVEELSTPFEYKCVEQFIGSYQTDNNGEPLGSTWKIPLAEIIVFYERLISETI